VASPIAASSSDRIASLDALRGLTVLAWLLCILGAPVLYQLPSSSLATAVADELSPSFWNGVTLKDLVLPMFLFVAGASIVPAFDKRRKAGQSNRQLVFRIARRVVLLFGIGILCEGGVFQHFPYLRFVGAFQRIAICYAIVACLELTTGWRFQAGLLAFLLIDYWCILAFGSTGETASADPLENSAAATVDQLLLPGRKYFGTWDPDGILTTIPAVAITIAGLLVGKVLSGAKQDLGRHSLWLLVIGAVTVNAGLLGDVTVAINPHQWTVTYCVIAIGLGMFIVGALHAVLGDRPSSSWATPVSTFGRNPLAITLTTVILLNVADLAASLIRIAQSPGSPARALIVFFIVGMMAFLIDRRQIHATL
jgi:predicted acyltransferase